MVGNLHRLLRRAEGHHCGDGAKDLDVHDGGGWLDVGEDRGRKPVARARQFTRSLQQRAAFGFSLLNNLGDALQLDGIDDGAHVDGFVQRVADAQALHAAAEFAEELRRNALLHEDARARTADLALVEPDGVNNTFNRRIEIRILVHDEGGLAAEFERELLARACGGLADEAAHFRGAGEGDLVHVRMVHDGRTRGAIARDDVDNAGRQARLTADFGEGERGQGREFCGLQHHRVACRERRRDLPRQHQEREVPRDDLAADADCLITGEFIRDQLRPAGMVVEMAGHQRNVDIARFADGLAIVHRLQHGEEALALLDGAGDGVEILRARMAGEFGPRAEALARSLHRRIDICRRALRDAGNVLAIGGVGDIEQLRWFGEAAIDEVAKALLMGFQPVEHMGVAFRGRAIVHGVEDLCDAGHVGPQASGWWVVAA